MVFEPESEGELGSIELSKVSFVDDFIVLVTSKDLNLLVPRASSAGAIVVDSLAGHGLSCNFRIGESEAMLAFMGAGSRQASKSCFQNSDEPCVQLETALCGRQKLLVTKYYWHLGGAGHVNRSMGVEVVTRAAMSSGAKARLRKVFKSVRGSATTRKKAVASALSLSLLRQNSACWHRLNTK